MLKLTKKADYGLIALKHLAQKRDGIASAKEMADSYGIPLPLLSKVLQKLAKTGFLQSEQGTHGGYRLARAAERITTLEVVRAIDGPIVLTSCFTDHAKCAQAMGCTVREPLRKVHEGILQLLASITIHDMAVDERDAGEGPAPSSGGQAQPGGSRSPGGGHQLVTLLSASAGPVDAAAPLPPAP